jgi:hypothetical protein
LSAICPATGQHITDVAQTRALLGKALRASGDRSNGRRELEQAASID